MNRENRAVVAIAHTDEKHRSMERVLGLVEAALLELGGSSQFFRHAQPESSDGSAGALEGRTGRSRRCGAERAGQRMGE